MKTRHILASLLAFSVMCCLATSALARNSGSRGNQPGAGLVPLTENEAVTLSFMYQEEKLAHDVYVAMYEQWGAAIFENIALSEERHMAAIENLLDKYEIPIPSSDLPEKDGLITRGQTSLLEAFNVGVEIEEQDIADLEAAIADTKNTDLLRVYIDLSDASKRHLAAFESHL
jgi:hypothetical protein